MLPGSGVPAAVAAQTPGSPVAASPANWSLIDAVGYAGFGFGAGLAATWDLEGSGFGPPDAALVIIGATTVAGAVAGAMTGSRAEQTISEGRRLGGAHRAAVAGGAVLAGATLGAVSAIPLINSEGEGTFLGSDERTVSLLVLTGGALGFLYVRSKWDQLAVRSVSLAPALSASGAFGMQMRARF